MFPTKLCIILAIVTGLSVLVNSAKILNPTSKLAPGLVELGTVEDKTYFVNRTGQIFEPYQTTWAEGKQFCEDLDMSMGTITTEEQYKFLHRHHNDIRFSGCFWIGGRDAHSGSQFVWDKDESSLSSLSFLPVEFSIEQQTCLYYVTIDPPVLRARLCSEKYYCTSGGVICEKLN